MTTKHEHEHAHTRAGTPPATLDDIAAAAQTLVSAAERLGPRITGHGYGCPTEANGPCTCGTDDFSSAMDALRSELLTLTPTP